jgi:hypothetical protein
MSTLITPPSAQMELRPRPSARKSFFSPLCCGLLGLLPGVGLIFGPVAIGRGIRTRAAAGVVLGLLALLVQTAALSGALWYLAGGFTDEPPKSQPPPKPAEVKKVPAGKNVTVEVQDGKARRVLINATVCLREGQLEQLLTRKQTKEHEAILAADVDGRDIHVALLAIGAKEGTPVKFQPRYEPATGSPIRVTLQYEQKGKLITVPAQDWIRNAKTGKNLNIDWVFAGSRLVDVPLDPGKKYYLANDGDLICVSNFDTALLDLPVKSPKDNAELAFEAHTERIPPRDTKVTVILELAPEKK